jgi:DNA-binding CsgD family transcriptional regulator
VRGPVAGARPPYRTGANYVVTTDEQQPADDPSLGASHGNEEGLSVDGDTFGSAERVARERVVRHLTAPPTMRDLRSAGLLSVLEYAERTVALADAASVPAMLRATAELVGADGSSLMRIDMRTGVEEVVMWPAVGVEPAQLEHYASVSRTHPLRSPIAFQARSRVRRPVPIRISDVWVRRQWRASPIHSASHRGIDDQMCVLIGAQRHTIQLIALSRHRGSFTDRQVALLDAARAHLAAAVDRIGQQRVPTLQIVPTVRPVLAPVAIPRPGDAHGTTPARASATPPTARQRQILTLVGEGLTDAQIGRRLGLTTATVSKHLTRSYARLGVPNRAAAARFIASSGPLLRTG